jgi:hypothetical protein
MRAPAQEGNYLPTRVPPSVSLIDYKLPDYLYYPTRLLPVGTRDWARLRLLQACHRLGIPRDLWPDFRVTRPRRFTISKTPPPFTAPAINILEEGATRWRHKANQEFRKHCDEFLRKVTVDIKDWIATGHLTRIKRAQGETPDLQRFEWAAERYCRGKRYKDMASDKYSDVSIRQAVRRIYKSAELEGVTKRGPID